MPLQQSVPAWSLLSESSLRRTLLGSKPLVTVTCTKSLNEFIKDEVCVSMKWKI